ncbi:hypothetical protein ACQRXC_03770 [Niallia taxi]|uniref:hypothetical protein n=1 Tax=Niallia taxi TaxID=2499688 RepID=UPI003F63E806
MPLKTVVIKNKIGIYDSDDCIVLRTSEWDEPGLDLSFPFDEDKRNMRLSFSEAANLRDFITELLDTKLLEKPRGNY